MASYAQQNKVTHAGVAVNNWAGDFECSVCRRKRLTASEFSKKMQERYKKDGNGALKCKICVDKAAADERAAAAAKTQAAAPSSTTDTATCAACKENLPVSAFTKPQLKKGPAKQRCQPCIAKAEADFNQTDWTIDRAIDINPDSAWGIHPQQGQPHRALFVFEKPLAAAKGDEIRIELHQLHGRKHLIGRPLLSLTNRTNPEFNKSVSLHISKILKISRDKRSKEQKHALAFYFAKAVNEREMASLSSQKKVYAVASQFTALGNFKPAQKPRAVHVLHRGSIHSPGKLARPGALSCVDGLESRFTIASIAASPDANAMPCDPLSSAAMLASRASRVGLAVRP